MKPPAIQIYFEDYELIKGLSLEQQGEVFAALFAYANDEPVNLDPSSGVAIAFSLMKKKIDRNFAQYQRKVETNRENGAKGGRPKNPTEPKETHSVLLVSQNNPKPKPKPKLKQQTEISRQAAREIPNVNLWQDRAAYWADHWQVPENRRAALFKLFKDHDLSVVLSMCGNIDELNTSTAIAITDKVAYLAKLLEK